MEVCKDEELIITIARLLEILKPVKDYIGTLIVSNDVCIRCFFQSDYAQMFLRIPPSVIKDLSNLNINMEISILSWGGVEE